MSDTNGPRDPNVWDFDQSRAKIRRKDSLGTKHPGYCAGMVVCWIMKRSNGEDFATVSTNLRPKAELTQEEKQLIGSYQDGHVNDPSTAGYKDLFELDIGKSFITKASNSEYESYNLLDIPYTASRKTKSGSTVLVNQVPTCFYIIRFQDVGTGSGHVIALEVRGNYPSAQAFRLMDPNQGCWEISSAYNFAMWFVHTFLKNSGYLQAYKRRIKFNQIIFVTPAPQNTPALIFQSVTNRLRL